MTSSPSKNAATSRLLVSLQRDPFLLSLELGDLGGWEFCEASVLKRVACAGRRSIWLRSTSTFFRFGCVFGAALKRFSMSTTSVC